MPNNIVFNNVANQLVTQIYGTDGNTTRAIKTDSAGRLEVVGTFTAVGTITAIVTENIIELKADIAGASGTGVALTAETLKLKTYSFYVYNLGSNTFKVKLQIAPVNEDQYFVDDSTGEVLLGVGNSLKAVLVPRFYMKYTRLCYEAVSGEVDAMVWFNGSN